MAFRVGLIGFGKVGQYVYERAVDDPVVQVAAIFTVPPIESSHPAVSIATSDIEGLIKRRPDLIVEVATPGVITDHGAALAATADLMPFSLTALAADAVRDAMTQSAVASGHRLLIPHGALLGLDGLYAARALLRRVTVTTSKPPRALGRSVEDRVVLFEGTTYEACHRFPRNVNVHAGVALAGIGFTAQRSRIVADPALTVNRHEVVAEGEEVRFEIAVESTSGSGVSGAFTPESAWRSIRMAAGGEVLAFV
jgi:aspartate dehydrogenase